MANKVQLKKSSVAARVPLTTDVDYGELALNYADGKLYYKKSDGTTIDHFPSVAYVPLLSGSYANPTWITSLDSSKLTGTIDNARLNGGTYSINITGNAATAATASTVVSTGGDFSISNNTSSTSGWSNRTGVKNQLADRSVFVGTYNSTAIVGAHNYALNAWAELYVNTSDGVNGATVRLPSSTMVGNNQVLHAGNYTSYAQSTLVSGTNIKTVNGTSLLGSGDLTVSASSANYAINGRVTSSKYPIGHYTPGEEVFAIDPTWTQDQLREYFNSTNVSWVADSTAPGGYAIQLSGAINVGGVYGSSFPYIPVETDDTFYMEVYIKDTSGSNGHYMGSIDFNNNFSNLGGNPGSFGYWVMSNSFPGTGWTKYSGYISGFGTTTGQFVSGTKYWTPQALFNYSGGGTSYISGWKVLKLTKGIVGRFPNSTVNTGEAWYGRANDRNRGTYTIQLGGNSASGRQFEVVDYAWSTVMFKVSSDNYSESAGSSRAPLFYDSNNTGYYTDPSGSSRVVTVNADTLRSYNNIYLDSQYGSSVIGVYSSYRYQGVFSMGDAYKLALDGTTTGNLYGLAWSHPNAGGTAGNLNTHGLLVLENGGFLAAISGSIRSRDDMRSPIFYDNNDTNYYVDGNNGSQFALVYANNWFRPQGGCGVYWQDYGRGIRASDSEYSYGNIGTYGGGLNGWRGYGIYPNNAILMANGSTVGIHNPQWGWVFQSDMNGNVTWGGNVTAYSDLRLKDNVREIDNVITRRNTLAKAAIKYERDGRTRVGYGAQILRDNGCSEFVLEADDALKLATGLGTLSVDYGETAAVLAVVSKMTDDKVSILENKVEELTRLIQQLIGD